MRNWGRIKKNEQEVRYNEDMKILNEKMRVEELREAENLYNDAVVTRWLF